MSRCATAAIVVTATYMACGQAAPAPSSATSRGVPPTEAAEIAVTRLPPSSAPAPTAPVATCEFGAAPAGGTSGTLILSSHDDGRVDLFDAQTGLVVHFDRAGLEAALRARAAATTGWRWHVVVCSDATEDVERSTSIAQIALQAGIAADMCRLPDGYALTSDGMMLRERAPCCGMRPE